MPVIDILYILTWWLTLVFITLAFIPTASILFKRFVDKGYIFAKVIGVLILSYVIYIGGYLKIIPFTFPAVLGVLVVLVGLNYLVFRKMSLKFSQLELRLFVIEELLFLAVLFFWSFVRAHQPAIEGLEKFMDYGFVRTMLASGTFPPQDMWLAAIAKPEVGEIIPDNISGFYINYYYFGHLVAAVLTRLSLLPAVITYNLQLATLAAFTFVGSFSLDINLLSMGEKKLNWRKMIMAGFLSAMLVTFAGNLHTIYAFTKGYPMGEGLPPPPWQVGWDFNPNNYWYPNATRFIPFTIHEFPSYSYIVSDLHGHVNNIPFVMLMLAGLLALLQYGKIKLKTVIGLGFLLAVFYMTNAWDLLIYGALAVGVLLLLSLKRVGKSKPVFKPQIVKLAASIVVLAMSFLLFSYPFRTNFRPISSSVGINCGYEAMEAMGWVEAPIEGATVEPVEFGPFAVEAGKCQVTKPWMHLVLWGFFYYGIIGYFFFLLLPKIKKFKNWKLNIEKFRTDIFVLLLITLSVLLLWAPEFVYIQDIYPAHFRANTMFKLGYQAYIMLSLVAGYTITKLIFNFQFFHHRRISLWLTFSKIVYTAILLLMTFVVLIYPLFGISSYYNGLSEYKELYGLGWLKERYPEDYAAVVWLDLQADNLCRKTDGCPVVLEAVGDSYTTYGRVSANTGLPTVVGWPVHEWLWRGSYDEAGKRKSEVETIYTSSDLTEVRRLLQRYAVSYVMVGQLEKEAYPELNESNFQRLGKAIYSSGTTKIYLLEY